MTNIVSILEERAKRRPVVNVKLKTFINDDAIDGELAMRPLVVHEINDATDAALKVRKALVTSLPEAHARQFIDDPTFLEDIKVSEIVWRSCRNATDHEAHAFPSAQWMRERLTNDELAALNSLYDATCLKMMTSREPMSDEDRFRLVHACAVASWTDAPDMALARVPHHVLSDLFVWLSKKYTDGRDPSPEVA